MAHEHRWWKTHRAGRRWRNQYGRGVHVVETGSVCRCGATRDIGAHG